jgi:hypothetical protein
MSSPYKTAFFGFIFFIFWFLLYFIIFYNKNMSYLHTASRPGQDGGFTEAGGIEMYGSSTPHALKRCMYMYLYLEYIPSAARGFLITEI